MAGLWSRWHWVVPEVAAERFEPLKVAGQHSAGLKLRLGRVGCLQRAAGCAVMGRSSFARVRCSPSQTPLDGLLVRLVRAPADQNRFRLKNPAECSSCSWPPFQKLTRRISAAPNRLEDSSTHQRLMRFEQAGSPRPIQSQANRQWRKNPLLLGMTVAAMTVAAQ